MKIVTNSEMRRLEQMAGELGLPAPALMENAGRAFVDALADRWRLAGLRAVVLCGPGNNGGDGLVAARHLADHGAKVSVFQVGRPPSNDAKIMLLVERRVPIRRLEEGIAPLSAWLETADLVVDALLGTGRRRPIVGLMAEVLAMVGASRRRGLKIAAMDLPSGLAADTGEIDPATLPTDVTITLGAPETRTVPAARRRASRGDSGGRYWHSIVANRPALGRSDRSRPHTHASTFPTGSGP